MGLGPLESWEKYPYIYGAWARLIFFLAVVRSIVAESSTAEPKWAHVCKCYKTVPIPWVCKPRFPLGDVSVAFWPKNCFAHTESAKTELCCDRTAGSRFLCFPPFFQGQIWMGLLKALFTRKKHDFTFYHLHFGSMKEHTYVYRTFIKCRSTLF